MKISERNWEQQSPEMVATPPKNGNPLKTNSTNSDRYALAPSRNAGSLKENKDIIDKYATLNAAFSDDSQNLYCDDGREDLPSAVLIDVYERDPAPTSRTLADDLTWDDDTTDMASVISQKLGFESKSSGPLPPKISSSEDSDEIFISSSSNNPRKSEEARRIKSILEDDLSNDNGQEQRKKGLGKRLFSLIRGKSPKKREKSISVQPMPVQPMPTGTVLQQKGVRKTSGGKNNNITNMKNNKKKKTQSYLLAIQQRGVRKLRGRPKSDPLRKEKPGRDKIQSKVQNMSSVQPSAVAPKNEEPEKASPLLLHYRLSDEQVNLEQQLQAMKKVLETLLAAKKNAKKAKAAAQAQAQAATRKKTLNNHKTDLGFCGGYGDAFPVLRYLMDKVVEFDRSFQNDIFGPFPINPSTDDTDASSGSVSESPLDHDKVTDSNLEPPELSPKRVSFNLTPIHMEHEHNVRTMQAAEQSIRHAGETLEILPELLIKVMNDDDEDNVIKDIHNAIQRAEKALEEMKKQDAKVQHAVKLSYYW